MREWFRRIWPLYGLIIAVTLLASAWTVVYGIALWHRIQCEAVPACQANQLHFFILSFVEGIAENMQSELWQIDHQWLLPTLMLPFAIAGTRHLYLRRLQESQDERQKEQAQNDRIEAKLDALMAQEGITWPPESDTTS